MGRLWAGFVAALLLIAPLCNVDAGGLALSGNARWVVLASRPDLDAAIGVARYHRWQFPSVRVVRAANGWFAVVVGPENATDPRALRQRLTRTGGLPSDFIFSRGDSYVEQVWMPPPSPGGPSAKYDGKHDSILRVGTLSVLLGSARGKDGDRHPVAEGREDGRAAFAMSLDQSTRGTDDESSTDFAEVAALRLDPISPRPSVVFTSFWGGAHCCTVTKIATQDSRTGRWLVADGETLDSGGYAFEDLDGDGNYELLSGDNSFLYAFGPYASSNPPAQIHWLRAGRLENVTRHANFAGYQRQRLAGMEHAASLDPERWHDNNFLGGWVAQSILIGRGEAAWARMLQLYDRNAEWPYEECAVALPLARCPDARKRKTDFPTALRRHLNEAGYPTPWLGPLAVAPPAITVPAGPARYEAAAATFESQPVNERIRLQVLLTATGYQVAVPNVDFSKRLFETVVRFQSQSGLPVTGMIDEGQAAALMSEATPLLRTWGFRAAAHPYRGHPIWTQPVVPTPPAVAPRQTDPKPHTASSGTGFFISRAGHLLTNAHVVQDCAAIEVNGPNGLVSARLVAQDRTNDLALLKAEITPVKIAALRTGVRLGEAVAVFGYPLSGMLSTSGNFTLGNVTALMGLADDSRYFQISAPVQPGNSGGPLVDASGNLIGVVSAKLNALKVMVATNGDIPQNVNFAIKGSLAGAFLESNGLAYATGTDTAALPPADLAEHAKGLSVFVACR